MNLNLIKEESLKYIEQALSLDDIKRIKTEIFGKKGKIQTAMEHIKSLTGEEKKEFASSANVIKEEIATFLEKKLNTLRLVELNAQLEKESIDGTLPIRQKIEGGIHPITKVINEITKILGSYGFKAKDGPEIENDFYNFTALNIPEHHPARQMHDTFYLKSAGFLLRTHTSSVQIRTMEKHSAPLKIFSIGKTFRCDHDRTHSPMFHQLEGLCIDENVNIRHLKFYISSFLKDFFGTDNVNLRLRPSFFPFTEPSIEIDISYANKNGLIVMEKSDNYMEIMGAGMVHPNVLKNCNIDSNRYNGFAFGVGIERLAMLKYGINDLRDFFVNKDNFLKCYGFSAYKA